MIDLHGRRKRKQLAYYEERERIVGDLYEQSPRACSAWIASEKARADQPLAPTLFSIAAICSPVVLFGFWGGSRWGMR